MEKSNSYFVDELAESLRPFEHLAAQKLKLIIHAGTPKTGTTSLQTYLDKKQRKLREKGILYPHSIGKSRNPTAPRHQWFEKNLVTTHSVFFLENFKNIVSQVKEETHTILLSSEGIYNYWWDFPAESKNLLRQLCELFDTEVWVWFREPLAFIESYYKQCIRNPQVDDNLCYGKDLSFAQMLDIKWFSQHLDYQGFVCECQSVFGENNISVSEYNGDIVQDVLQKLDLKITYDNPAPRLNNSLNSASIALLRTVNQYNVKAKDKERVIPHLKVINDIFQGYENRVLIDDESRKKVLDLYNPVKF